MAVAATMAAEEAATTGGAARAWAKTAAEVAAATGNTTVLDHVPAPWEVAEKVENVRRDATHITAEAGTQAQRVKDFIQLFAQYSGGHTHQPTRGCASAKPQKRGKRHHERHNGRRRIHIRPAGVHTLAGKHQRLSKAASQRRNAASTRRERHTFAVRKHTERPTGSATIYTVDGGSGRRRLEGMPAHRHARKEQQEPAGVIELTTNKARQVDWAGIWRMTPAGDNTNSASGSGGMLPLHFRR
ncbi:hypothetical protein ERJ75_001698200 [Trypanosoma vivax]|nr:hypothetical protein ERJ75_001698200 [Trypanosoma vivax]